MSTTRTGGRFSKSAVGAPSGLPASIAGEPAWRLFVQIGFSLSVPRSRAPPCTSRSLLLHGSESGGSVVRKVRFERAARDCGNVRKGRPWRVRSSNYDTHIDVGKRIYRK